MYERGAVLPGVAESCPPPCTTEASCKAAAGTAARRSTAPARSATFNGPGNLAPPPPAVRQTQAQGCPRTEARQRSQGAKKRGAQRAKCEKTVEKVQRKAAV